VTTNQCRSGPGTTASAWPVPTLERTYPGRIDQGQPVRAALRSFLGECPVADEVTTVVWELAANACLHSNSSRPGGQFGRVNPNWPLGSPLIWPHRERCGVVVLF
jgi:hypothetical protein